MAELDNTATHARLKELLHYDAETGTFMWLKNRGRLAKAGQVAGSMGDQGYRSINFMGKAQREHRLAWLFVYGEWPKGVIDHINGVRDDNRISNLRDTTFTVNAQNRRHARVGNKSGFLGVAVVRDKFQSWICLPQKKRIHLGTFTTAEEAHAAYVEAKRVHHGGNSL